MSNYILYKTAQSIVMSLPLKFAYKAAMFVSDVHYIFADKDRARVKANLKAIFPGKSDREICRVRLAMFRNFAKYLVDFFRFSKIGESFVRQKIKIINRNYLDEALAMNRGVIVVTAHLGNWELGGAIVGILGYPFWAVALSHKDKRVDDFFVSQRASKGVHVIPLSRAGKQCLRVIDMKEILGLVGDRDFNGNGVCLDFFGKPSLFPKGPAAFAIKTKAPILPAFMLRNEDDSFSLKFEKPMLADVSQDKEKDLLATVGSYKIIFERYIREYPDQWYMFRRFWVE